MDKTYILPISPDYVINWRFWEAVRELIQNSVDQKHVNPRSEKVFEYDNEALLIGNLECKLPIKSLLLGYSDKREDRNAIGKFGEGYKLALLVLTRLSYDVIVRNSDEVWVPKLLYSEDYGDHVLTVTVTKADEPIDGVRFEIRDVSSRAYGDIHANYLMNIPNDKILFEDYFRGRVFVGGLFICNVNGLRYGYNFAPSRVQLDRDRSMITEWDASYHASELWSRHPNQAAMYDSIENNAPDTRYVSVGNSRGNYFVQRFLSENPDAVPVSSQAEIEQARGRKFVLVPKPLRDILHRFNEFVAFVPDGSPAQKMDAHGTKWRSGWGTEQRRDFERLCQQAKDWRE